MSIGNGRINSSGPIARSSQLNGKQETQRCGFAVMAKASMAGRAKTRLVPPLSFDEAAAFNTAFLQDIADNLLLASRQVGIAPYVAFGPPESENFFRRILPQQIGLMDAWFPDFGQCLLFAVEEMLRRGHSAAVVLNSDSPTLPTSLLFDCARLLAQPGDRAVLGPSTDGGYYMLGIKHAHRHLFEGIAWSTERVAEQTLARARDIGLNVHVLPAWYDVDDVEALCRLYGEFAGTQLVQSALRPYRAPMTGALMSQLCRYADLLRRIGASAQVERLRA